LPPKIAFYVGKHEANSKQEDENKVLITHGPGLFFSNGWLSRLIKIPKC